MRRSCTRPPWVSLRKRIARSALTSRTFLTGPGGGRCAVRFRHGQKGGVWHDGGWLFLQWGDQRGRVSLRDPKALGQGREGAGGSIAKGAERREQHGQEEVNPLVGFALDHTKESSLDHLQRIGLDIRQNKQ